MTSTTANNVAAIAAAINGAEEPMAINSPQLNRRSFTLKPEGGRGASAGSLAKLTDLLAETNSTDIIHGQDGRVGGSNLAMEGSAVDDGPVALENEGSISRARVRRASEGAHLSRSEGKRSSGELRCEKCGKGYKHSSCLTKHLLVYLAIYAHSYTLVTSSSSLRGLCYPTTLIVDSLYLSYGQYH